MKTSNNQKSNKFISLVIEPKIRRYYSDETNFGIYVCNNIKEHIVDSLERQAHNDEIIITGNMPELKLGVNYNITCEETHHKIYGKQYKVQTVYNDVCPENEQERFLRMIVTPRQAEAIMSASDNPIDEIRKGTLDLNKTKGIGEKTFLVIKQKVEENITIRKALCEFSKYGITYNLIKKIVKKYGSADLAIMKINGDPYTLYRDIKGVGFIKADAIALSMGVKEDSYSRIQCAIMYTLEQNENFGSTWIDKHEAQEKTSELLGFNIQNFDEFISEPILFHCEGIRLSLRGTYECELEIAKELKRINEYNMPIFKEDEIKRNIEHIEQKNGIKYTDEQKQIFYNVSNNAISVLTGYAGVGKTATLKGLLDMLDMKNLDYVLMSPTAKAAKVIERLTGRKAGTIHRVLGLTPEAGKDNFSTGYLMKDIVIIDEASMCDIYLFRHVLKAIKNGNKILLVGDPAQLESVATGNVLNDIIKSKKFSTALLDKVFRQALDSGILSSATNVRQGRKFYNNTGDIFELGIKKDCKVWFGQKEDTATRVCSIFKKILGKYHINDIMVISPMKNGVSGIKTLNTMLQEIYNPKCDNKNQIDLKRCIFREGDKVLHIKNYYDAIWLDENLKETSGAGVFNGDTGIIKSIDKENGFIYVDYEEKIIEYHKDIYDMLELAYCMTVHKSQGSASPVVICAMDYSHYMMLKRSLLYTAITRASELLFLVADKRAVAIAIKNDTQVDKNTHLCGFLKNDEIN